MSQHSYKGRPAQRHRQAVLHEYGNICHLCGLPGATTVDHLIPRSLGGDNSMANSRPAHSRCNSARGNKPLTQWFLEQKKKSIAQGMGATHDVFEPQIKPSRNW